MKRLALTVLALFAALATVQSSEAQVIGTYRPSVVTYYPTSTSVLPAPSQPPIAQASYYGATTVTPVANVSAPLASQAYYGTQVVSANGCQCAPLRSYPANVTPTAYYSQPVAYAAPAAVPVQTVSYAAQPALGSNRYIGTNIFGNPKVYANGQPLRNALRWLGP
jgi:hypothetical protein